MSVFRLSVVCFVALACGKNPLGSTTTPPSPPPAVAKEAPDDASVIAFGSCNNQTRDQAHWSTIAQQRPDAVLMLGDNVYGDLSDRAPSAPDLPELAQAYADQAAAPAFASLRAAVPFFATWDDHDYGLNDAGGDFPHRDRAEALFLDFWEATEDDVRRTRPGVFADWLIPMNGRVVQLIALDTRSFRSPLVRGPVGGKKYAASPAAATMLGDAQWAWLEQAIQKPADLKIVMSSIQVISTAHGWERWDTMPHERQRLLDALHEAGPVIIASGDRHIGGLYRHEQAGSVLVEITSSALNQTIPPFVAGLTRPEADPARINDATVQANFGWMAIDWEAGRIDASLRDTETGDVFQAVSFSFAEQP